MRVRVASLVPAGTEIVSALGMADTLVGRSHCCDHPPEVVDLPALSESKVDPSRPAREVDREVRRLLDSGESVYRILGDRLRAARPDVVVTQDHCEACAVSLGDVRAAVACEGLTGADVCALAPHDLQAIAEDFVRVARALGVPGRGERLARRFRDGLLCVSQRASPEAGARRPRVAMVEWLDPPMVAGGWLPELARIAGGEPVIVTDPVSFRPVTWAELEASRPDAVVVMPCGFDVGRTIREARASAAGQALDALDRGAPKGCWVVDGDALFNRPGPRLVESAELLASILRPDRFPGWESRHGGRWARWSPQRAMAVPSSRA